MGKLLVCQHVAYEILGTLDPLLRRSGFRIRYVNFDRDPDARPRLDSYDGLVILGGPMSADQVDSYPHLDTEVELIRMAIDKDIAVLGICLGAQLLARALGAQVRRNPIKEIGWYEVLLSDEGRSDPLLRHFDASEKLFQWHGDTFDLPAGAVHLASSAGCANQAFRFGSKVYGLQFHLECDEALIERWLNVPLNRDEIEQLGGQIDPQTIRRQTPANVARLKQLSDAAFGEFIALLGVRKRYRALPSR